MTDRDTQILLTIDAGEGVEGEELERVTRRMRDELLQLDVESVNAVPSASVPQGSKGDPVTIGTLLVMLVAQGGVLTTLIRTLPSLIKDHGLRKMAMEIDGDKLELTGVSSEEQQILIDSWLSRHK